MADDPFHILFVKLWEARSEETEPPEEPLGEAQTLEDELQEISELRRIVHEITEPEPPSYTST